MCAGFDPLAHAGLCFIFRLYQRIERIDRAIEGCPVSLSCPSPCINRGCSTAGLYNHWSARVFSVELAQLPLPGQHPERVVDACREPLFNTGGAGRGFQSEAHCLTPAPVNMSSTLLEL